MEMVYLNDLKNVKRQVFLSLDCNVTIVRLLKITLGNVVMASLMLVKCAIWDLEIINEPSYREVDLTVNLVLPIVAP